MRNELIPTPCQLVVVRNPFDRTDRRVLTLLPEAAPTVEALVGEYIPAGVEVHASINGHLIPREEWASRRLARNDQLVVVPQLADPGEDGNPLAMLAMIAVISFAPYAAAGLLGGTGMMTAGGVAFMQASAAFEMMVLTAGISMGASMVVSSLFAPSRPSLPSVAPGSYDNSPAYSWAPQTLQTAGAPIARGYGRVKLYGNIIAGFIDTSDDTDTKQVAHALIDLGHGQYSVLNDIKINDQALDQYQGVTVISRLGLLTQDTVEGFNDTRVTRSYNTKVVAGGAAITKTTVGTAFGSLEVVLNAPQGMFFANDAGGMDGHGVYLSVEVSLNGSGVWKYVSKTVSATGDLVVVGGAWSQGYWAYGEDADGVWARSWVEAAAGSGVRADHNDGDDAGATADYWSTQWRWLSDGTHGVATTVDARVLFSGQSPKAQRKTIRIDGLAVGSTYDVRVTNLNPTDYSANARYGDAIYFAELNEVILDDFTYPRSSLVGVKAIATEQLNGQMKFSCVADAALVWVYRAAAWHFEWSNNPAWVCWDIITQPVNADAAATDYTLGGDVLRFDGFNPSRLVLQSFIDWADFCDELVPDGAGGTEARCQFDGVFDSETDMWSAALEVASTARATLVMRGTNIAAVFDDEQTAPRQLFTVANDSNFTETFLPMEGRASVIEVEFSNVDLDYGRDTVTIVNNTLAAAWGVSTPHRKGMRGVTRASQAWREANTMLARNELLQRTAEISVDIDSIACTVGDRVDIQEDVTLWGEGGRAVSGTTTTIVLDHAITLAGGSNEIAVRLTDPGMGADDTGIYVRAISTGAGTVTSLTFTALPYAVRQYDVWSVGPVGQSTKPFIITHIGRDSDRRALLSLIEYNASLYGLDAGIKALPTPNVSASTGFSRILLDNPSPGTGEVVPNLPTDHLVRYSDGTIVVMTNLRWWFEDRSKVLRTKIAWREIHGADWQYAEVNDDHITIGPTPEGIDPDSGEPREYLIFLACVNYLGQPQPWSRAQMWRYIPTGKTAKPADVAGFAVATISTGFQLSWTANADVDLYGYEIRSGGSAWGTGDTVVVSELAATKYLLPRAAAGAAAVTYRIKAIDSTGNYSATAATVSVSATAFAAPTVTATMGITDIAFKITAPTTGDNATTFGGVRIYLDTSAVSATPSAALKVHDGKTLTATIGGLSASTNYHWRAVFYDWLGNDGTISADATAATTATPAGSLSGSVDFATQVGGAAKPANNADVALPAAAAAQSTADTAVTNAATAQTQANTATTNAATAQSTANTAVTNAATAQSAANAAQSDATTALANAATANATLANIASDSILSPSEKPAVVQDYAVITGEQAGIDAQATAYGITTTKTAYDSAVTALTSYLGGLTGWNTVPGTDVTIVGTTFRGKFADVYTTKQALLDAIVAAAKALADAAQSQANTATSNASTAQSTANTAVSNAATAQSTAVAAASTAVWGGVSSIPANIATAGASPSVSLLNSGITLSASGVLSGGGGGTVDLGSLGGSVTTGQLSANIVAAVQAAFVNLAAIHADLGTITAGDITTAKLRTAASGTRIAINDTANQIEGYTNSNKLFTLRGGASAGTAAGTFGNITADTVGLEHFGGAGSNASAPSTGGVAPHDTYWPMNATPTGDYAYPAIMWAAVNDHFEYFQHGFTAWKRVATVDAGMVLQVKSTTLDTTASMSGTGYTDISGLSVSITPSNSANKILVIATVQISGEDGADTALQLVRGSTAIGIGAVSNDRVRAGTGNFYNGVNLYGVESVAMQHLDSPATTSETTYKVQLKVYSGTYPAYVNRSQADRDGEGYDKRYASTITVMEIKG